MISKFETVTEQDQDYPQKLKGESAKSKALHKGVQKLSTKG